MAHFAQVDENWVVQQVIVVNNSVLLNEQGIECDWLGEQFCQSLYGVHTKWIQTSYNASKYKNFAGIGYTFDPYRNAFIPPKPYPSWVLNEESCQWDAPMPYPDDGELYFWDEESGAWLSVANPTQY
jgi:hypothetical protein